MSVNYDKLDALLRMYFDSSTTQGEKNNAYSIYKKLCVKYHVDADEYLKTFQNKQHDNTFSRSSNKSSESTYRNDYYDYYDIFSKFWKARQETENYERDTRDYQQPNDYYEFTFTAPIYEVKYHNGKRVVFINAEVIINGKRTIQNFCLYSNTFNPDQMFDSKSIYTVWTGKTKYFRDHYSIKRMWVVNNYGYKVKIPI